MVKGRLFALASLLLLAGCSTVIPTAPTATNTPDQESENFSTFVVASALDARLPAPGAEEAAATPEDLSLAASARDKGAVVVGNPVIHWNRLTAELAAAKRLPPPHFSRAYALVHIGIYDALVAGNGQRRGHLPQNALAAGAAFEVLLYLFPEAAERITAEARAQAAFSERPGRAIGAWVVGRAVGRLVVRHGKADGSDAVFTGTMPTGDGIWTGTNPVLPLCGTWKCWVIGSVADFMPEPPYAYGSAQDLLEVQQVYDASLVRTAEQIAIVHKWADRPPPAIWNGLLNDRLEAQGVGVIASARAHAWLNATMADAFIACWEAKYKYWTARPFQRTPGLVTVIPTPNFPSYTSGHSTISGAAAVVMGKLFPSELDYFHGQADEAALSRFLGGIHFHHDDNAGLEVGRRIGAHAVSLMSGRGRPKVLALR